MLRILDITLKDLLQIVRNRLTFLFLIIMPIGFTLLFGIAFGGSGAKQDARLPVGYLDLDGDQISLQLRDMLNTSTIIRLDDNNKRDVAELENMVKDEKLAAAIIIPAGYGQSIRAGTPLQPVFITDPGNLSTPSIQNDLTTAINHILEAARTARVVAQVKNDPTAFEPAFNAVLAAWQHPPIQISVTSSQAIEPVAQTGMSLSQSSPGMMLQFGIAGLLSAATIIVTERKSRSLQRLLTTATSHAHILLGHYLAIFIMVLGQFFLLIIFGQLALKVDYLRLPLATLLVAITAAACIAALGLLIGVFAKSEEQAIIYSLIPMFILAGLGGAWVPLESTGATFQAIGHVSPVAWALDGFKNIAVRGLPFHSILLPAAALTGYAVLFFGLAGWRFWKSEEK